MSADFDRSSRAWETNSGAPSEWRTFPQGNDYDVARGRVDEGKNFCVSGRRSPLPLEIHAPSGARYVNGGRMKGGVGCI